MALFTTISAANRVVDQGDTWDVKIKPTGQYTSGTGNPAVTYGQYKAEVALTKRYRYVGLTETAAMTLAETIRTAYTQSRSRAIVRWDRDLTRWAYEFVDVEDVEADVTSSRADGPIWQIDVSVNASKEYFYNRTSSEGPPTVAIARTLLSGISDFPEITTGGNP